MVTAYATGQQCRTTPQVHFFWRDDQLKLASRHEKSTLRPHDVQFTFNPCSRVAPMKSVSVCVVSATISAFLGCTSIALADPPPPCNAGLQLGKLRDPDFFDGKFGVV